MLSVDQITFLEWISKRSAPITLQQMSDINPPGFSEQRVSELMQQGYLNWRYVNGQHAGYYISDKGKAVLEAREEKRRKESEAKRQQRFQNQISIAQVLVPLVTFVLGLVVEHYIGFVSGLSELLRRWVE